MKAVFRNFISFLSFLVKVFGEKHYQGYFDFVGFITSPQLSSVINEFHQKSLFECSSECLLNENCYIFDFCENGSSISCYFYHYDFASTSDVESGACRRYELVRAMLLHPYCISWYFYRSVHNTCTYASLLFYWGGGGLKSKIIQRVILKFFYCCWYICTYLTNEKTLEEEKNVVTVYGKPII